MQIKTYFTQYETSEQTRHTGLIEGENARQPTHAMDRKHVI